QRNDERAGMPVWRCAARCQSREFPTQRCSLPDCRTATELSSHLPVRAAAGHTRDLCTRQISGHSAQDLCQPSRDCVFRFAIRRAAKESRTGIKVNDRGYGVINFEQIGPNAAIELSQALRDLRALNARSVQLSAPVNDPGLPGLTDAARGLGFFFCGLGPAFLNGADTFLLQSLTEPLDTGKLQLFTEMAKELVTFIDRDRAATQKA